ncbi:MAG TPA: 3,4-dihydroxy-2-butanone-4-phosphate synthase [Phycisphaeraceae bacterium]
MAMHPIPDILADLRAGKMIVLIDDEQRENEGDLVCAAELVTPQIINFMLREARGMMCVALEGSICDRLGLEPQGRANTALRSTAYTVSVDADERFGITTGVSAADRATTIRVLMDEKTQPGDLVRPGHVQPLRAREGGCLVRAGQTEGSVDLCRLAGLRGGAVIIEIMNDDGTMARQPQLEQLCAKHGLKMCSVADVIHHRLEREKLVERIDSMPLESPQGRFNLIAYRSAVDPFPHVALTCGGVGLLDPTGRPIDLDEPVLVRMHSQNLLGDVFGDLTQPSGRVLRQSLQLIQQAGQGALVYLRHEGMGTGLLQRLQSTWHALGQGGSGTYRPWPASDRFMPGLKSPHDKGAYGIGCQILRDLGIRRLRLLTNHPFTPTALSGYGLTIEEFIPIPEADEPAGR